MSARGRFGEKFHFKFFLPQAELSLVGFEILKGMPPGIGRNLAFGASPCV
ncbi:MULTISPECIES: hypothetical protein [Phaeobacter]